MLSRRITLRIVAIYVKDVEGISGAKRSKNMGEQLHLL